MAQALAPNIRQLAEAVIEQNPTHRHFMQAALAGLSAQEAERLDSYVSFCLKKGVDVPYLAECYLTIVSDTLREQIFFQKNGHYRHDSFAAVAKDVYFNPDYMSHYMHGLALTAFLWPNHLAMFTFFEKTLPRDKRGAYLEIGPGHGYYLMTAMALSGYSAFTGVDISETSIAMTRELISHFSKGRGAGAELRCLDFLAAELPAEGFDAIVMGEVLEHVEQPELFLRRIHSLAKKDAYIYVTTCINAPAVDHIYLFRTPEQLTEMFKSCGLAIKDQLLCPYQGLTLAESLEKKLAINVAYVLQKA